MYRDKLEFENYLIRLHFSQRTSLCKFRCVNRKIPTVIVRFVNIEYHDRLCELCDRNTIGDEFHYIFECPYFTKERSEFLKSYLKKKKDLALSK